MIKIPPTRNHHQLARWINTRQLFNASGRRVKATVTRGRVSTDSQVAGTRFRREGRGRASLRLEIWLLEPSGTIAKWNHPYPDLLFRHESGDTYRKHDEARDWVKQNLRATKGKRTTVAL